MYFSETNYDYDTECFLKEQRDYQRYYNTPLEVDDIWFSSLAEYDVYIRIKQHRDNYLQKLTIDLKTLIQDMVHCQKIKKMYDDLDSNFPQLIRK